MIRSLLLLTVMTAIGAVEVPNNLKEFIIGNRQFSGRIYNEFLKDHQKSFVLSPFSIQTILALTQHGTKGLTNQEILNGVNLPKSGDSIKEIYLYFRENLSKDHYDFNLTAVNKIYVKNGFKIFDNFVEIATKFYQSSIENIDFLPKDLATDKINNWVEEQTNHKIKNLLNPDSLNRDTVVILINTLYFQGRWLKRFNHESTETRKFYKSADESVGIASMRIVDLFNYYECNKYNAKFIELPYLLINASMVIVLPNQINGLEQLERSIDNIFDYTPNWSHERVNLTLPKFEIETRVDLVEILKSLGIKRIFNEDADLSGLGQGQGRLCVDKVLQKTFITVGEEGTEAATATAVIGQDRIGIINEGPTFEFNADHPFLFYIKINEIVYFAGRYL